MRGLFPVALPEVGKLCLRVQIRYPELGGLLPVATPTRKGLITNNEKKYFPQEYKTSSEETSYLEIASGFPEYFYGLIKVSYIRVVPKEGGLIYIEVSRHASQDFQLNALTHVIFGNSMKVYLDRNNNKIYISVKSFTNVSVSYESYISSSYCITAKEGNTVSSVAGFIEV